MDAADSATEENRRRGCRTPARSAIHPRHETGVNAHGCACTGQRSPGDRPGPDKGDLSQARASGKCGPCCGGKSSTWCQRESNVRSIQHRSDPPTGMSVFATSLTATRYPLLQRSSRGKIPVGPCIVWERNGGRKKGMAVSVSTQGGYDPSHIAINSDKPLIGCFPLLPPTPPRPILSPMMQ